MTKLSDTQAIVLSAACQRFDGNVLPLPGSLRGGAAKKVVGALISRSLIAERPGQDRHEPDAALNTVWRNEPDGRAVRLYLTDAGRDAIGVEPESADAPDADAAPETPADSSTDATGAPKPKGGRQPRTRKQAAPDAPTGADGAKARKTRAGTKQALLIEMLRRPEGATIAQIMEATGWQSHTVRGAFAGALKRKLGLSVTSEKVDGGDRVYKLPAEG